MSLRWEDAHSDCSRGLVRAVAPVWHAPRRSPRPPYQWRRESRRARDPDQHSGTPSIHISTQDRFEPCEADVSLRWEDARSDCSRGLVRLWLRHGTLLGALRDLRARGVAVPVVLERLSNTLALFPYTSPRKIDLSRAWPM